MPKINKEEFIRAATVFLFFGAVILLINLAALTWPVGVLLAIAAGVRLTARAYDRRRSSKVAKAVVSVTFPYVCGLACVTVLQLVFNLARIRAANVANVEDWLLAQSDRIARLNRMTWWEYVAILILLGAAGVAAPRLRLLSRFVGAVKIVEAVSGVLATITAFTFVTAMVGSSYVRDSEAHFRARLADKVRDKKKVMADTLVNEAVAQSIERLPPASVPILAAIEIRLHPSRAARSPTDELLDLELGEQLRSGEKPPAAAAPPAVSPADEVHGAALLKQPAVEDKETKDAEEANKASKEAVEAALDRVADSASGAVGGRVREVIERIVRDEMGPLLSSMIELGSSFTSEYVSQLREPLMKKADDYCDRMADRIAKLRQPGAAASMIRARARSDAIDEAIRLENDEPGNAIVERLGGTASFRDAPGSADRTGDVTRAIDIAISLTPGAGRMDWGTLLPSAGPGDREPAGVTAGRVSSPPGFADHGLERAVEGVARFHMHEVERIEIAARLAKAQRDKDRLSEMEHDRAEPAPHE